MATVQQLQQQLAQQQALAQQAQQALAKAQQALTARLARKRGNANIMAETLASSNPFVAHYYATKAAALGKAQPATITAQPTLGATSVGVYSVANIVGRMAIGQVYSTPQVHGLFANCGMQLGGRNSNGSWPGGNTLPTRLHAAAAQGLLHHTRQGNTNYWQRVA